MTKEPLCDFGNGKIARGIDFVLRIYQECCLISDEALHETKVGFKYNWQRFLKYFSIGFMFFITK